MIPELDAIKARAEAATEGPWATQDVNAINECTTEADYCIYRPEGLDVVDVRELHNAEFIAAARSDIPRLVAALEAVLALHKESVWTTETHSERWCEECLESPSGYDVGSVTYPCPTVATVERALKEEQ